MAPEEQIIYLPPEEDLTNVTERLAQTQVQRIMLVVPSQTQLRSHVSWRILFSRVREMGKDVLVFSPDRQIRLIAREAGFRVADSLDSPARSKQGRSGTPLGRAARSRTTDLPPVAPFRRHPRLEKRPQIEPAGASSPERTSPTPRVADLQPPRSLPTVLVLLAILVAVSQIVVNVLQVIEFWSRRKEAREKPKS